MGRHSAPDDDEESEGAGSTAVASPPASGGRPSPGRHSHADDASADDASVDHEGTAEIDPIVDPVLDEPVPAAVTTVIAPVDGGRGDDLVDDLFDADEPTAPAAPEKAGKSKKVKPPKEPKAAKPPKEPKEPKGAKPPKQPKAVKPAKPKRPEPHVSDRALLRADSSARARVIAAVVAPFVLYVVVLLALDALDVRTLLIWIWIPLITAGVVAGLILDLAHRATATRTAPTETKT